MKRLDSALSNPQWKMLFEDSNVLRLPRTSSDHHPVLINTHPPRFTFGQHPFFLETIWFIDQSFPNLVDSSWQRHPDDISRALLDFTKHVKVWNQNSFRNIFHKKKRASRPSQWYSKGIVPWTELLSSNPWKEAPLWQPQHPPPRRGILGSQIQTKLDSSWWQKHKLLPFIHHLPLSPTQNLVLKKFCRRMDLQPLWYQRHVTHPLHQTIHYWSCFHPSITPRPQQPPPHSFLCPRIHLLWCYKGWNKRGCFLFQTHKSLVSWRISPYLLPKILEHCGTLHMHPYHWYLSIKKNPRRWELYPYLPCP